MKTRLAETVAACAVLGSSKMSSGSTSLSLACLVSSIPRRIARGGIVVCHTQKSPVPARVTFHSLPTVPKHNCLIQNTITMERKLMDNNCILRLSRNSLPADPLYDGTLLSSSNVPMFAA